MTSSGAAYKQSIDAVSLLRNDCHQNYVKTESWELGSIVKENRSSICEGVVMQKILGAFVAIFFLFSLAPAQKAEITVVLNEQFFDALLDAIYKNGGLPDIPLAENKAAPSRRNLPSVVAFADNQIAVCSDSLKLLRESNSVRTAIRFRDGKIYAPIAFSGSYSPPFVGCVDFAGYAETNIDLEFDQQNQRLIGRATVLNVSMNGTGGLGGNVLAKMVQNSIDKKVNPVEILRLDKLSFPIPIQNSKGLTMKAVGVRHDIGNGTLNIHIDYEFTGR
jgi:hypothetical protein